jgi:hypothetical protein
MRRRKKEMGLDVFKGIQLPKSINTRKIYLLTSKNTVKTHLEYPNPYLKVNQSGKEIQQPVQP